MGQYNNSNLTLPYYLIEYCEKNCVFIDSESHNYLYFAPDSVFFENFIACCLENKFDIRETYNFFYYHFIESIIKYISYNLQLDKNTEVHIFFYKTDVIMLRVNPKLQKFSEISPYNLASLLTDHVDLNDFEINAIIYHIFFVYKS